MMTSFERSYYEAESFWNGDALMDAGNQARVQLTASIVPRDAHSVLDAGCGNGVFGRALAAVRPDIALVGMDRSAAALRYVTFDHIQGSLDSIPFAEDSFDCVTCLQVIEHLPLGIYETALRELARVSRRYVIIGVPYREDLEKETTTCPSCKTRFNVDLHLRSYDDKMIDNLFTERGGRLLRIEFPARRRRLMYVNEVMAVLRRGRKSPGFLSPVCPVCGYSEGDKTALSASTAALSRTKGSPGARWLVKSIVKPLKKLWPQEEVKGYWAICLYDIAGCD